MTPWEIEGRELVSCNCNWGCPCQFNAPPTYGHCQAAAGFEIEKGHYGEVDLSGVRFAGVFKWPGAIHEGKGECLPVVDARATPEQREAVLKIMSGQDTDPGATVFAVFATTFDKMHDPVFEEIDFESDVDARKGRVMVDGVIEVTGEPIRNPITGDEHRARIDLTDGFEYQLAEVGSATTRTHGPIELSFDERYAQFARIHLNNHGVVRA